MDLSPFMGVIKMGRWYFSWGERRGVQNVGPPSKVHEKYEHVRFLLYLASRRQHAQGTKVKLAPKAVHEPSQRQCQDQKHEAIGSATMAILKRPYGQCRRSGICRKITPASNPKQIMGFGIVVICMKMVIFAELVDNDNDRWPF